MRKLPPLLTTLSIGILLLILWIIITNLRAHKKAIVIESNPQAKVIIDGKEVGNTPYQNILTKEKIIVKLTPEEGYSDFIVPITLTDGVKTILRRNFGPTVNSSDGEIISFESSPNETSISIITSPSGASIEIDGKNIGLSPKKIERIKSGNHKIKVSKPNFEEKEIEVKVINDYMLTANVYLKETSKDTNGLVTQNINEVLEEYAVILETPNGFLRVRKDPSQITEEIGRVSINDKFKVVGKDEKNEWLNIEISEGQFGWVSAQYASISAELKLKNQEQ